jgi:hypothetical protein
MKKSKAKGKYQPSLRGIIQNIKQKGAARIYMQGARTGQELRPINI